MSLLKEATENFINLFIPLNIPLEEVIQIVKENYKGIGEEEGRNKIEVKRH